MVTKALQSLIYNAVIILNMKNLLRNRKGINAGVVFALAMAVLAFVILGVIVSVGASITAGVRRLRQPDPWHTR